MNLYKIILEPKSDQPFSEPEYVVAHDLLQAADMANKHYLLSPIQSVECLSRDVVMPPSQCEGH